MAYTETNFKSKKALKEAVAAGEDVYCYQPGLGPDLTNFTGRVALEGPQSPTVGTRARTSLMERW